MSTDLSISSTQLAMRLTADNRLLLSDTRSNASTDQLASDRARVRADQQALNAYRDPMSNVIDLESNSARGAVKVYL